MKKCQDCGIEVPPTFARALLDNRCPACGKPLMSGIEFAELRQVRNMLADLSLDERLTTTIAAAIASKFDLVPKGQGAVASAAPVVQAHENPLVAMSEEQKVREAALLAAKQERESQEDREAIAEWGLDKITSAAAKVKKGQRLPPPPQDFVELFDDSGLMPLNEIPPEAFASGGHPAKNTERMARLAKSDAVRTDGSKFKVRRD